MEPYDTSTSLDPARSGFNDTFSDEDDLYNNSLPLPFFRHDTSIGKISRNSKNDRMLWLK